ncbi:DedA family protein [Planomicrobium okeanokoites]|uniref:DedA family protein n=1 Tax=Planomicrobium okeanokoites TaxID=244 RepID=A0ABV7KLQ7_PLAOK|nr:DedA family protein [Planomicrobium okeanokoites]TAA65857.1 DedA family protein [Planomicrobium okeanokoites]
MEAWITSIMEDYGYTGIFFLILMENIFPPIPSEIVLTVGGFMTTTAGLSVTGVIAASTAGSVAGAVILYYIGRWLSVERLEGLVEKYGKWLRLKKADLHKADAWFDRYGVWAVFFGRLVPVVRSLISVPAGMSGMKVKMFLLFTIAGTLIWNTILVVLGAAVGENREVIMRQLELYSNAVYILLAVGAVVGIWIFIRKRRKD